MRFAARVVTLAATCWLRLSVNSHAASEIAVAIRYLQAEGVSHSHLYLYRDDGKFLRQLTSDSSGQDVDPIFAPDGGTIVFTREKPNNSPLEFWSVQPLGTDLKKLDSAPDWYEQTKTSPYFTNRGATAANESPSPSASTAATGMIGERKSYKASDGSVELILRE